MEQSAKERTTSPQDRARSVHRALQSDPSPPTPPHLPRSKYPGPTACTRRDEPAGSLSRESTPATEPPPDSQFHPAEHPVRAAAAPPPSTPQTTSPPFSLRP